VERIESDIDMLTRLHLDRDREHSERAAENENKVAEIQEFPRKTTAHSANV
jgi:hypothetical protein